MRFRLRTLMAQFSIRDLVWLTLVVACLTAWWHTKRENSALRNDHVAKAEAFESKSRALEAAKIREDRLRTEVDVHKRMTRSLGAGLAKKDAELRESLERREEVLKALRTLKDQPPSSN